MDADRRDLQVQGYFTGTITTEHYESIGYEFHIERATRPTPASAPKTDPRRA